MLEKHFLKSKSTVLYSSPNQIRTMELVRSILKLRNVIRKAKKVFVMVCWQPSRVRYNHHYYWLDPLCSNLEPTIIYVEQCKVGVVICQWKTATTNRDFNFDLEILLFS